MTITNMNYEGISDLQRQFIAEGKRALDMAEYCKQLLNRMSVAAEMADRTAVPIIAPSTTLQAALQRRRRLQAGEPRKRIIQWFKEHHNQPILKEVLIRATGLNKSTINSQLGGRDAKTWIHQYRNKFNLQPQVYESPEQAQHSHTDNGKYAFSR